MSYPCLQSLDLPLQLLDLVVLVLDFLVPRADIRIATEEVGEVRYLGTVDFIEDDFHCHRDSSMKTIVIH